MNKLPNFIDNSRINLADVLNELAPNYKDLSIATGYWDLKGTLQIIDKLEDYETFRLLIGKEPIADRYQQQYQLDIDSPENLFPESDIKHDLQSYNSDELINNLRETVSKLVKLIEDKKLEVKIFRSPRLHAKAYIFGGFGQANSVGIIGSSNFTYAGLTSNAELNYLTDEYRIVEFKPENQKQENGHLSWFDELWNSEDAIEWTGEFSKLLEYSPVGDTTYGAYDVYIKTLMEVFSDELIPLDPLDPEIEDILHDFQKQNAASLRRKLKTMKVAMLSDSVGLGKTITAAAIIKQYLNEGKGNILVIAPAALKRQWIDELHSDRWKLKEGRDFRVLSMQDMGQLQHMIDDLDDGRKKHIEEDLIVIDEAHNLRSQGSTRYQKVLEFLQHNYDADVLLLTATPINNSLIDFANQIQLGAKGLLNSISVPYYENGTTTFIDFFKALNLIQSSVRKAERANVEYDWNKHRDTLTKGIRHYLVRATRQGVINREALKPKEKGKPLFPTSVVEQINYSFENLDLILSKIDTNLKKVFDNINPRAINLDIAQDITQRTAHPLDIFTNIIDLQGKYEYQEIVENYNISEGLAKQPFLQDNNNQVIPIVFRIINMLGFTPYKPNTYDYDILNKPISEIKELDKYKKSFRLKTQLSIHNMLHVTWLKRLESSTSTLFKSLENYKKRLNDFKRYLDKGYIITLTDISFLEREYGEDIDRAFDDYNQYISEYEKALQHGNEKELKKYGVERIDADPSVFNIEQLRIDLEREETILKVLEEILKQLSEKGHDEKLERFADEIVAKVKEDKFGSKILVFSFFSDTIDYLKDSLPDVIGNRIPNFKMRSAFVSGNNKEVENIAKRFSPESKKYKLKDNEGPIDFLFSTDVLSEGQNLQDAGILINYDLHWNPVRMIQRNGRINRLGSNFEEIFIANAIPSDDLEQYLKLVRKLESKIAVINNSVGNDQSILGEAANPIEFMESTKYDDIFSNDSERASKAMDELENQEDILDWSDTYSLELRNFLDNNTPEEIERIKSIPRGKWNYLPSHKENIKNNLLDNEIIGLYEATGYICESNEEIRDTGFIKMNELASFGGYSGAIQAEYMIDQHALALIKTTPDDNKPLKDNIMLNRSKYFDRGKEELKVQVETKDHNYNIKPQGKKVLDIFLEFDHTGDFLNDNLIELLQHGIKRSNEVKEFERLTREIIKQIKERKQPYQNKIRELHHFIQRIKNEEFEDINIEKVEGVLFYAKK